MRRRIKTAVCGLQCSLSVLSMVLKSEQVQGQFCLHKILVGAYAYHLYANLWPCIWSYFVSYILCWWEKVDSFIPKHLETWLLNCNQSTSQFVYRCECVCVSVFMFVSVWKREKVLIIDKEKMSADFFFLHPAAFLSLFWPILDFCLHSNITAEIFQVSSLFFRQECLQARIYCFEVTENSFQTVVIMGLLQGF